MSEEFDIKDLLLTELKNQKNINDDQIAKNEYGLIGNVDSNAASNAATININSIFGFSKKELVKELNPNLKKTYILLDRRFRYSESEDHTTTTWVFQNNKNVIKGSVNALGPIRDIVNMRIYDMNINIVDTNFINPQNIMTVFIPEFSAQSFIGPIEPKKNLIDTQQSQTDNSRFHFWGTLRTGLEGLAVPNYDLLFWRGADLVGEYEKNYRYTDGNNGLFEFTHPITSLDKISVSFGYPYQKMILNKDTFGFTYLIPSTAPSGSGNAFVIRPSELTNIPSGDYNLNRVYISDFMTDDPIADATLINLLNNPPDGIVYVGEINGAGPLNILIYPPNNYVPVIDFPAIVGTQTSGTIYFDFYRFYVALELTYISN